MKKTIFVKSALFAVLTLAVAFPVTSLQAGSKAKYKSCVRSCQAQFADCYRHTKNRNQCRARQAQCSQACATYLSSWEQRMLAMMKKEQHQ